MTSNLNNQTKYLENAMMDHGYRAMKLSPTNVRIGEIDGHDIYLTVDELYIANNKNFYNRSQSLQDPRNQLWIVIGMETMDDLGIRIFNKTRKATMPNPLYQAPQYNKNITIKGGYYPDLSIREQQELNIYGIFTKEIYGTLAKGIHKK